MTTTRKFDRPDGWAFDHFRTDNGLSIRYGYTFPPGKSRGTVVLTGGYGRHIEYYYEAVNNWRDRGYTVYAMDWAGMGGSEREDKSHPHRPPTMDFGQQSRIFHEFTQRIVRPDKNNPAFLVSHSMGAHFILRYLHDYEGRPDFPYTGAMLAAPLIDINTSVVPRSVFSRIVNAVNYVGLDEMPMPSMKKLYNDFVEAVMYAGDAPDPDRDAAHERHRRETHDLHVGYPTAGWLRAALDSIRIVRAPGYLDKINTPILILTADRDSLVSVKAQEWAAMILPHAALVKLRGGKHGLWYDCDRVQSQLWHSVDTFAAGLHARHKPNAAPIPPPANGNLRDPGLRTGPQ